jgi:hypothetical protein
MSRSDLSVPDQLGSVTFGLPGSVKTFYGSVSGLLFRISR